MANASNTTAPTQFIQTKLEKYAYRRFGKGQGLPLLCLQHFTGTLDNWDPAVIDPLALGRDVILFESAGLGRSTGQVPENMAGMAAHALAFVDSLGLKRLDSRARREYSLKTSILRQDHEDQPCRRSNRNPPRSASTRKSCKHCGSVDFEGSVL